MLSKYTLNFRIALIGLEYHSEISGITENVCAVYGTKPCHNSLK